MNNRAFGRRTLAIVGASTMVLALATSVFANAANPGSTVTPTVDGLKVTLSGTWTWLKDEGGQGCDGGLLTGKRDVGFAADWGDAFAGNFVQSKGAADGVGYNVGDALDNIVHQRAAEDIGACAGDAENSTGSWGPISHTYAAAGTYTVCVLMYDIHYSDAERTTLNDASELVASGASKDDHNKDNSAETNGFVAGGPDCAGATTTIVIPPPPPPGGGVLGNNAVAQGGVTPIPTIVFSLILLAALGTLAYANVKTVRNRS